MADIFDDFMAHADVVSQPDKRGEAKAWCPWHADREGGNPSLGINVRKKAVKCFVCGGGIKALAKAWDVERARNSTDAPPWERDVEATYEYHNPDGSLRFQATRFEDGRDPRFMQRRPDPANPGRWLWNLRGVQPVLYHLRENQNADAPEEERGKPWLLRLRDEMRLWRRRARRMPADGNPRSLRSLPRGFSTGRCWGSARCLSSGWLSRWRMQCCSPAPRGFWGAFERPPPGD